MEFFLAKELFSIMGFKINVGTLLKALLMLAIIVGLYLGYRKIREPYELVKALTAQVDQLKQNNQTLTAQKTELEKMNKDNASVYAAQLQQQKVDHDIASNEATASAARVETYKEIQDAIDRSSPDTQPVPPVILDTAQRLWGQPRQVAK